MQVTIPPSGDLWYWAAFVGAGDRLVTLVDTDLPRPPRGPSIELRGEGIWADHICETPYEHWTVGLEAFAVELPAADGFGKLWGDRVPLGFDLEWELDGPVEATTGATGGAGEYTILCRVDGEVLVADRRLSMAGHGWFRHEWGREDPWGTGGAWTCVRWSDGTWLAGAAEVIVADTTDLVPARAIDVDGRTASLEPIAFAPVAAEAPSGPVHLARALVHARADDGSQGLGWVERWSRVGN